MRNLFLCAILAGLNTSALAEEVETVEVETVQIETVQIETIEIETIEIEEIGIETRLPGATGTNSEGHTIFTLSQWIEDNGGQAAVDIMLAQEAEAEAKQSLKENPEETATLKAAAKAGMDKCEETTFGAIDPLGGPDYSDADFSVSASIPLDAFFRMDWSESRVSIGSHGYGVTTSGATLFNDPSSIGNCLEAEIDKAVDRIIDERDKLLDGDLSTVKKVLAAAAVDYLIDEASEYNSELGEMLGTLEKICTSERCF